MSCKCPETKSDFSFSRSKDPLSKISKHYIEHYTYSDNVCTAIILSCSSCKGYFVSIVKKSNKTSSVELMPLTEKIFENLLSRKGEFGVMCQREGPYYLMYGA